MAEIVHYNSNDLKEIEAQFRKLVYGQGFTIIIVDKSPTIRKTLMNDLKTAGYEAIEEATKHSEAMNLLVRCEGKIALITDLDLPGTDGIVLIRAFLAAVPDGVAIMIGDRTTKDKVTQAVAAGARGFFPKPVDLGELRNKLAALGFALK